MSHRLITVYYKYRKPDPQNLTQLWGRRTSDLWTGKGTKKEISDMFWSSLSSLHFNPPPPHHKHTHILEQEMLDHMNSHSQRPHLPSSITSLPPPPIQSGGWKKQGFLDTSWRLPGVIYLFILKNWIPHIPTIPDSEFRHSGFSNLPSNGSYRNLKARNKSDYIDFRWQTSTNTWQVLSTIPGCFVWKLLLQYIIGSHRGSTQFYIRRVRFNGLS